VALDEILAEEGGMRINKAIADYLVKRLRDFNEWGQCTVLALLHRYEPEGEDDYYEMMVRAPRSPHPYPP
jgi:AP-4 complex subunit beta-1